MSPSMKTALSKIASKLVTAYKNGNKTDLNSLKASVCAKLGLASLPKLADIISSLPPEYRDRISHRIQARPVRTASGIAVVAVMCKPHRCPHVEVTKKVCVYCPGGPDSDFEYSTQAYTGYEPTSMRGIQNRYDPYQQSRSRIEQLEGLGHTVDKVEFIVMGGTFMSLSKAYRDSFIKSLHDSLSGHQSNSIEESICYSSHSKSKCIGITIETRPDYCHKPHLNDMLIYGCTRLEIGIQSIYEDVALDTNRGHTVQSVIECFEIAKDCGFKIVTHMMPNLPNVNFERDIEQFKACFESPSFRTDGLKIYPTLVIRGTGLYELWKTKRYKSYSPEKLINLLTRVLSMIPPWTRVYRIQRDIPMPLVTSGVEKGNIRELVNERMINLGLRCMDIRSREVGIREIHGGWKPERVELVRRDYIANNGWETFLSYEDPNKDILIGMLRLRKLSDKKYRNEFKNNENGNQSMIRELHIYGGVVPVHSRNPLLFQHQGYGSLLLEEAERISKEEHGSKFIHVISGIGVRKYYEKHGFKLNGVYMSKSIGQLDSELFI